MPRLSAFSRTALLWACCTIAPAALAGQTQLPGTEKLILPDDVVARQRAQAAEYASRRPSATEPVSQTAMNPRTELAWITDKFKAYHLMLDVVGGVEVYAQLLIPRDAAGRPPAVICQHGRDGTAGMITGVGQTKDTPDHEYGRHLAEQGYVVVAPLLVPDPTSMPAGHPSRVDGLNVARMKRVVDFLGTMPNLDSRRIGYFGPDPTTAMLAIPSGLVAVVICGDPEECHSDTVFGEEGTRYIRGDVLHTGPAAGMPGVPVFFESDKVNGKCDIRGIESVDFLDRFLRPGEPVGRDYEYAPTTVARPHIGMALFGGDPFVTRRLDGRPETRFGGSFRIPDGATEFRGLALKVSRDGYPGPIEVRFGSTPGENDVGTAQLRWESVSPLYEPFVEARIAPHAVNGGDVIHFDIRCAAGRDAEDHYLVYGPRPLGGVDRPERFGLSFRVLTDRPLDTAHTSGKQQTFEHVREMMGPYYTQESAARLSGKAAAPGETSVDDTWSIRYAADSDGVLETAAGDLQQFLSTQCGVAVPVAAKPDDRGPRTIALVVSDDAELRKAVSTEEGYRVEVTPDRIVISGIAPRGVMRGVYWIEDTMRFRGRACLTHGTTDRNCRFRRRITCTITMSGLKYNEIAHPLPYTDGILQRISHQGFNAIWLCVNLGEITRDSRVFPELNHPQASRYLDRIRDVADRARPLGIDVFCYYTNEFHSVPESFFAAHPDCRGSMREYRGGSVMCFSHPDVLRYLDETTRHLFEAVPHLGGLVLIFDCEGFMHCGVSGQSKCPRCRTRRPDDITAGFLGAISTAMHAVRPRSELIAWSYLGRQPQWVDDLIPKLPQGTIYQTNFDRGAPVVRDGITNFAEDYIISELGPPDYFVHRYDLARKAGIKVMAKTEHAISQEFISVPYIPCLRQWHDRCRQLGRFDLDGLFCNWCHYGYTPSRPAEILMWYSWTGAPPLDDLLGQISRRDFGKRAGGDVCNAWEHFTQGIRYYPFSNPVTKAPGPIQTGPSQPLFLDPAIKPCGGWRAWQNDIRWTRPWGPDVTAKYLRLLEDEYAGGIADLQKARRIAAPYGLAAIDAEIGIAETIRRSAHTMLNLIAWVPLRDAYAKASPGDAREQLRKQLIAIGEDELVNARAALVVAEADSRIGASSSGDGMPPRGGLFTPALIRKKIGLLEDILDRQLAGPDR